MTGGRVARTPGFGVRGFCFGSEIEPQTPKAGVCATPVMAIEIFVVTLTIRRAALAGWRAGVVSVAENADC